jgi:hypothetical protein
MDFLMYWVMFENGVEIIIRAIIIVLVLWLILLGRFKERIVSFAVVLLAMGNYLFAKVIVVVV